MSTDANAIYQAVFPATAQRNIRDAALIQSDIAGGYITKYTSARPQDCAQAKYNPASYQQTGGGLGIAGIFASGTGTTGAKISSAIGMGLQAIPIVGQFLSQIWTTISPFAHHAAAVAKEQTTLCTAVPEFDANLGQIEAALKAGSISATDADAYVDQAVQNFDTEVAGITQESGNTCNAGCVMRYEVKAVGQEVKEKFQSSPLYYLKHYWYIWVALGVFLLLRGRD